MVRNKSRAMVFYSLRHSIRGENSPINTPNRKNFSILRRYACETGRNGIE